MRIKSVRIKNFRSFKDATILFNNYTCLVGPNNAGKSTVINALNVFFREVEKDKGRVLLSKEDFHHENINDQIEITVTFCDLTEEAEGEFEEYVQEQVIVLVAKAEFDEGTGRAEVKQYGRLSALEGNQPEDKELDFYGRTTAKARNPLSDYLQWMYIPAVKDVSQEQVDIKGSYLRKLLDRITDLAIGVAGDLDGLRGHVQNKYDEILQNNKTDFEEIARELDEKLVEWVGSEVGLNIRWEQDEKSVIFNRPSAHVVAGEEDFKHEISRWGHGLQRSYLFVLLQKLSSLNNESKPNLILGYEEPELYQHPPQTRRFASILNNLSEDNAQVILSTHSPYFVSGQGFEDIRMIRKESRYGSAVTYASYKEIRDTLRDVGHQVPEGGTMEAKLCNILQPSLNEMFFTQRLVLVEGLSDIIYLMSHLDRLGKMKKFRELGCHIVSVGGKSNLFNPVAIAKHFEIPTYVLFDSDRDTYEKSKKKNKNDPLSIERMNKELLELLGKPEADPLPKHTFRSDGFTMWNCNIEHVVKKEIEGWQEICQRVKENQYRGAGNLKKNSVFVSTCLQEAFESGKRSHSLEKVCSDILKKDSYMFTGISG